jgi:hypothetical protein
MQAIEATFHWWRKVIEDVGAIRELCLQDVKKIIDG